MTTWYVDPQDGQDNVIDIVNAARFVEVGMPAIIDTTAPKHGAYSLNTNNGNGAYMRIASDAGVRFGAGMFTIEVTGRLASHSAVTQEMIIAVGEGLSASNLGWALSMSTTGTLNFMYSTSGTARINIGAAYNPPIGTDIDFAVDCDADGLIRVYADGAVIASATRTAAMFNSTQSLNVGNHNDSTKKFPGAISGVRITKGVARYAGAYTAGGIFATSAAGDPYFASVTCLFVFNNKGDGTSFEERCRTMQYGLTNHAAGNKPVAGDDIRFIASPPPASLGNVAWTNASRTLTLPAPVTQTIDNCDAAWTGMTSVTSTAATGIQKQGTAYASLSILSAFTTGKVAYRTLPAALDLSAYQQISMWFRSSSANVLGNTVEVRFCTDNLGDVPVHVVALDMTSIANTWRILRKNFKAPLNAAIKSISVWTLTDFGAAIVSLDNIIAHNGFDHSALIGKMTAGEPEWYPILSIDGTTVILGGSANASEVDAANTPRPYSGVTETTPTYYLQPLDTVSGRFDAGGWSTFLGLAGSESAPVIVSGGWDRTSMTTQVGDTWITGLHVEPNALTLGGNCFNEVSRLGFAHFYSSPFVQTASVTNSYAFKLQSPGTVGCGGHNITYWNQSLALDLGNIVACTPYGFQSISTSMGELTVKIRRIAGTYGSNTSSGMIVGAGTRWHHHYYVDKIDNGDGHAVKVQTNTGKISLYNPVYENNRLVEILLSNVTGDVTVINPLFSGAGYSFSGDTWSDETIRIHRFNRNANDHRSAGSRWTLTSDATVRHADTGYSWKLAVTGTSASINRFRPAAQPIARVEVKADVPVTILTWAKRDANTTSAGTMLRAGCIGGVASDLKTTLNVDAAEWQQLALSFTPTEDGVVELLGWNATSGGSAWFNEISVA